MSDKQPVKKRKKGPPPKTWKAVENRIAAYWGARRRGADYKNRGGPGGKNDVIVVGWSIEVKHSARPTWGLMAGAVAQAEGSREKPDDIPVAVIHKAGTEYGDSLVVMRLSEFAQHFINQGSGEEDAEEPEERQVPGVLRRPGDQGRREKVHEVRFHGCI